jgi:N-methylhydantoinase A
MTWLINVENGGTTTGFCHVDGGEVRYTKTLTTPYDLSRCLFDGLAKVSELAYGRPRLAALLQSTDCIRYSTTQGTNALVQRAGPQLGLLVTDLALVEGGSGGQACSSGSWSPTLTISAHLVEPAQRVRAPGH